MIIAQIIGDLSVGGAEKHFVNLVNEFSPNECHAFFLGKDKGGASLHHQLGNHVISTRLRIRKRSALLGIMALARELRKCRCDVVHTHMFWANLYGTIAARLAGVPVIVTTEHGENRWKKARHRWLERNVISRITDMRYCVSKDILIQRREVDRVPANKLQLVANGTTVPVVPAEVWNNAEVIIGSVGRFVRQKNFELFVDVIGALCRRGYNVRGCLVGDGPEMQNIQTRIDDLGLEAVIELPGMVTETESWFRRFDIYAITSTEEGLPVSLLEAMSYGLPVVATDVGAIAKAMCPSEEGVVVPSGDAAQFVEAIAGYLDNREVAAQTGVRARDRIIRDFSIEAIAAKYTSDYRAILDQKKSR